MDPEQVDTYLMSSGPYFTDWEGEEPARIALARQGADITPLLLERACAKLSVLGKNLDHFLAGPISERAIRQISLRTFALMTELTKSTDGSQRVAAHLLRALDSETTGQRAFAALCCNLKGVPVAFVIKPLTKHFEYDTTIVQVCCALLLAIEKKEATRDTCQRARAMLEAYIQSNPVLSRRYAGKDEGRQLALYGMTLLTFLPNMIAVALHAESGEKP